MAGFFPSVVDSDRADASIHGFADICGSPFGYRKFPLLETKIDQNTLRKDRPSWRREIMAESSTPPKHLFLSALDLATGAERTAFLDRACGADLSLRRQIEAMLRAHFAGDSFLEKPAAAL